MMSVPPASTVLIVNPAAGGGRAARALDRVLEALVPLRPFDVYVTQPGVERPAERAARDAVLAGVERILVLGGDGSSSQAANGIYAAGGVAALGRVSLGLLAAGTGRDYARSVGAPRDPVAAARALARGAAARRVDVGQIRFPDGRERLFLNVASFGISAQIAHALEEFPQLKRRAGAIAFGLATVRAGLRYAPDETELRLDLQAAQRGPTAAVAIANGGWFGGGMHVAPTARLRDQPAASLSRDALHPSAGHARTWRGGGGVARRRCAGSRTRSRGGSRARPRNRDRSGRRAGRRPPRTLRRAPCGALAARLDSRR